MSTTSRNLLDMFSENFKYLRLRQGFPTRKSLSIKSGISEFTLDAYENGRTLPNSAQQWALLLTTLDVEMYEFFCTPLMSHLLKKIQIKINSSLKKLVDKNIIKK